MEITEKKSLIKQKNLNGIPENTCSAIFIAIFQPYDLYQSFNNHGAMLSVMDV